MGGVFIDETNYDIVNKKYFGDNGLAVAQVRRKSWWKSLKKSY